MKNIYPRVLVISHNTFCDTTAMGRTLNGFFQAWKTENLAQLYFHNEIPTTDICCNYFRITDIDVLKSIFTQKHYYSKFSKASIQIGRINPREDKGLISVLYQFARNRSSLIYYFRSTIWKLGKWYSIDLKRWIDDYNPQVVFFASGDYEFSYKIAKKICDYKKIPLILYCCDDNYLIKYPFYSIFRRIYHYVFLKKVKEVFDITKVVITICNQMASDYNSFFNIRCETIYTSYSQEAQAIQLKSHDYEFKFLYLGNLGLNRHKPLIELAHSINSNQLAGNDSYIHVYSSEKRKRILKAFSKEPGIIFHGEVGKSEVDKIIQKSEYVLHVESFRKKEIEKIRYSISTKIPDLLASNSNILVYGPRNVASVDYLANSNAAIILSKDNLLADLQHYMSESEDIKQKRRVNAKKLVVNNHDSIKNRERLKHVIQTGITKTL